MIIDLNNEERPGLLISAARFNESRENGIRQNQWALKNDEHLQCWLEYSNKW